MSNEDRTEVEGGGDRRPTRPGSPGAERSRRFRLVDLLGKGGMAEVFEAEDTVLDRRVAVKQMNEDLQSDTDLVQRFFEEARILGGMFHPGLVPVYDAGRSEQGRYFYAMQKVEGETLAVMLRGRPDEDIFERSSMHRFVDLMQRVCETVAYAHSRGVIHRDLKPANVMVDAFGAVQVLDWGLAKMLRGAAEGATPDATEAGVVMGTPSHMSPEQVQGLTEAADPQTDVFALGVILYEVLAGVRPFRGKNQQEIFKEILFHVPMAPRTLNRNVPRALSAICMKALAKDPRVRYRDAGELAEDLRRYRQFLPVSAIRPTPGERFAAWSRRHPVSAAVVGTTAVAVILAGVLAGYQAWADRRLATAGLGIYEESLENRARIRGEIGEIEGRMESVPAGTAARARLALELEELRAEQIVAFARSRTVLGALLGFTFYRPDERIRELGRTDTLEVLDRLLEANDNATARAFARMTLEESEGGNLLGFTATEIELIRDRLGEAERRLEGASAP